MLLKDYPEWRNIQLATAPTPWEWEKNLNNFVPLAETSETEIRKILESVQYMKLCRFHALSDSEFPALNWANTGLTTWKILSKVCVG